MDKFFDIRLEVPSDLLSLKYEGKDLCIYTANNSCQLRRLETGRLLDIQTLQQYKKLRWLKLEIPSEPAIDALRYLKKLIEYSRSAKLCQLVVRFSGTIKQKDLADDSNPTERIKSRLRLAEETLDRINRPYQVRLLQTHAIEKQRFLRSIEQKAAIC